MHGGGYDGWRCCVHSERDKYYVTAINVSAIIITYHSKMELQKHSVYVFSPIQGLTLSMLATVLPDLRDRIGCTTAEMTRAITASNVTSGMMAILAGFTIDRYRTKLDLVLAFALAIVAITVILKPLVSIYSVLCMVYAVEGIGIMLTSLGKKL